MIRVAGKEADWYPQSGSSYPTDFKILLYGAHPSVSSHLGHKFLYVFSPFREVYLHIAFPNLSPVFPYTLNQGMSSISSSLIVGQLLVHVSANQPNKY